jgi:hypothetical protein
MAVLGACAQWEINQPPHLKERTSELGRSIRSKRSSPNAQWKNLCPVLLIRWSREIEKARIKELEISDCSLKDRNLRDRIA